MIAKCAAAGVLTIVSGGAWTEGIDTPAVFVDRVIASQLHAALASESRPNEVAAAHRLAAEYWQWRAAAWPQSHADIHDLIEARHHLIEAGEIRRACELTEVVCAQLHAWGDLDREAELISDTLAWLPETSPRRAALVHGLGQIAQVRRDYVEAERRYLQALDIFAWVGDRQGGSRCHHGLGVLRQARGHDEKAERCYPEAGAAATP